MGDVIPGVREKRAAAADADGSRQKDNDRLNAVYAEFIASNIGAEIMEDLAKRFGAGRRRFLQNPNGSTDPWSAAVRDGESAVVHYIETRARKGNEHQHER